MAWNAEWRRRLLSRYYIDGLGEEYRGSCHHIQCAFCAIIVHSRTTQLFFECILMVMRMCVFTGNESTSEDIHLAVAGNYPIYVPQLVTVSEERVLYNLKWIHQISYLVRSFSQPRTCFLSLAKLISSSMSSSISTVLPSSTLHLRLGLAPGSVCTSAGGLE